MTQGNQGWQQFSPGDQVGVYRLVRQIGEGGMGFIWEVEHIGLGRRCALKIMRQDQVSEGNMVRFLREARISAQLDPYLSDLEGPGRVFVCAALLGHDRLRGVCSARGGLLACDQGGDG